MDKTKKKILIVPSWYPTAANPISGSFIKEQAQLMHDYYDIKVLFGLNKYVRYKRSLFGIIKQLKLKRKLFVESDTVALTPPEVTYVKYSYVPFFPDKVNYGFMLSAYNNKLNNLIAKGWKPDLIHAHCTVNAGIIAAYLSRKHNIPAIITEHQVFLLHNYSKFIQNKIFKALESVHKVVAVSYHQMRCILMHNINCNPIVIGNYINENIFFLKERQDKKTFKILTVTYPSQIKDNDTFFKAIALMIDKGHTNISVTVIGNNSNNINDANIRIYEELAEKYKILKYCSLISHVNRENMFAQYHEHNVFVSTSIAETFGLAICEAIATGIPVVSTNCGGVDDIVNNKNGIKVNIKDYESVAEALIKIKTKLINFDPLEVRESIVDKFGTNAFKAKLIGLYNQTMC